MAATWYPERRVNGQRVCSLVLDGRGAALYWPPGSAQERDNGDNVGQASVWSEEHREGALVPNRAPVPAIPCAPTREAGTILPKRKRRHIGRRAAPKKQAPPTSRLRRPIGATPD
jgi:hypothetical protein